MTSKLKIWHNDKRTGFVLKNKVICVKSLRYFLLSAMFSVKTSYTFKIIPYELCSLFLNSLFL